VAGRVTVGRTAFGDRSIVTCVTRVQADTRRPEPSREFGVLMEQLVLHDGDLHNLERVR